MRALECIYFDRHSRKEGGLGTYAMQLESDTKMRLQLKIRLSWLSVGRRHVDVVSHAKSVCIAALNTCRAMDAPAAASPPRNLLTQVYNNKDTTRYRP